MLELNQGTLKEQPVFLTINSMLCNKTFPGAMHHTNLPTSDKDHKDASKVQLGDPMSFIEVIDRSHCLQM